MKKILSLTTLFTSVFTFILIATANTSMAQAAPITRVAATVENNQTKIWLSDFPKKATVVVFDDNNNLLTVISTNEFGAAYTTFDQPVLNTITAKTLNGDILVTNKAVLKGETAAAERTTASLTKSLVKS